MRASNFLQYSETNTNKIDNWIREAIAIYVSANYKLQNIDDGLILDYQVKCSMRQWGFVQNSGHYKPLSKWAIRSHDLVIDSVMRDQHIVELNCQVAIASESIKIALPAVTQKNRENQLHSISNFKQIDFISEISKRKAIAQIRWIEIPGLVCGGIFFSTRQKHNTFVPIYADYQANELFTIEDEYQQDYIFEVIKENSLIQNKKSEQN